MTVQLGAIALPEDLQWVDEFGWLPVAQQVEVAGNGALIVEESVQLAGRPITLEGRMEGSEGFALATRATIKALQALASNAQAAPLVLLFNGATYSVRFNHAAGLAVEARPMRHIVPHVDADFYSITLRLMQV